MAEANYPDLQRRYGGQYIARDDDKIIASAATYQELSQQLDQMVVSWVGIVIEYVEPITSVSVY